MNVSILQKKNNAKRVHCPKFKERKFTLVKRDLYMKLFKALFTAKYPDSV